MIPTAQRKPRVQGVLRVQPSFGAHSAGEVPAQVPTAKATERATARAIAKATASKKSQTVINAARASIEDYRANFKKSQEGKQ